MGDDLEGDNDVAASRRRWPRPILDRVLPERALRVRAPGAPDGGAGDLHALRLDAPGGRLGDEMALAAAAFQEPERTVAHGLHERPEHRGPRWAERVVRRRGIPVRPVGLVELLHAAAHRSPLGVRMPVTQSLFPHRPATTSTAPRHALKAGYSDGRDNRRIAGPGSFPWYMR